MSIPYPDALISTSNLAGGSYSPIAVEELPVDPGTYSRDDMVSLYDWLKTLAEGRPQIEPTVGHIRMGFLGPSGFNAQKFRDNMRRYVNSYAGDVLLYAMVLRCVFGIPTEDLPLFVETELKTVKLMLRWRLRVGK